MKARPSHGFTLVEMVVVIAIILILAGLVAVVAVHAIHKGARSQAAAEMVALNAACENYKADNGVFPRQAGTTEAALGATVSPIDPRNDGDPSTAAYRNASLFLYDQLWGATA